MIKKVTKQVHFPRLRVNAITMFTFKTKACCNIYIATSYCHFA